MPGMAKLLNENPQLGFSIITKELNELMSLLKSTEVDFVITNQNPEKEDLESIYLGTEENVLIESKKHPESLIYLDHDTNHVTTETYFKLLKKSKEKLKIR